MFDFLGIPEGPAIPPGYTDLKYGTCGFRADTTSPKNHLDHVAYRCGIFVAAIPTLYKPLLETSWSTFAFRQNGTKCVPLGVMITASHNPHNDNGFKLLEPTGNLVSEEVEYLLTQFVNSRRKVGELLAEVFKKLVGNKIWPAIDVRFLVGWDTRDSGPGLVDWLRLGALAAFRALGLTQSSCVLIGEITTPTLPFLLCNRFFDATSDEPYLAHIEKSFLGTLNLLDRMGLLQLPDRPDQVLFLDCSYGVGGRKFWRFRECLRRLGVHSYPCLSGVWRKPGEPNQLNKNCGAAYTDATGKSPLLESNLVFLDEARFCAFDGDADRLIYFFKDGGECQVVDGSRLVILAMKYLRWLLEVTGSCKPAKQLSASQLAGELTSSLERVSENNEQVNQLVANHFVGQQTSSSKRPMVVDDPGEALGEPTSSLKRPRVVDKSFIGQDKVEIPLSGDESATGQQCEPVHLTGAKCKVTYNRLSGRPQITGLASDHWEVINKIQEVPNRQQALNTQEVPNIQQTPNRQHGPNTQHVPNTQHTSLQILSKEKKSCQAPNSQPVPNTQHDTSRMADKPHPPDAITSPTDVSPSCKTTNQTGEDPTTTYPPTLSILILQTGYTNGAGLAHIQYLINNYNLTDFRVHWQLQPCNTGVKHVNRRSVGYDITLHYEVNGHGSVVISKEGIMRWCDYYGLDPTLLLTSLAIYSPAMGDGIVNCLQVELALKVLGLEIEDVWRFYESLPSSSRTVRLERSELETFRVDEKDEQVLMEPKGLVEFVGKVAKEASGARVFVRPSGTEALVRVYVEASTTERAEELAGEVANVVANQRVANPIG